MLVPILRFWEAAKRCSAKLQCSARLPCEAGNRKIANTPRLQFTCSIKHQQTGPDTSNLPGKMYDCSVPSRAFVLTHLLVLEALPSSSERAAIWQSNPLFTPDFSATWECYKGDYPANINTLSEEMPTFRFCFNVVVRAALATPPVPPMTVEALKAYFLSTDTNASANWCTSPAKYVLSQLIGVAYLIPIHQVSRFRQLFHLSQFLILCRKLYRRIFFKLPNASLYQSNIHSKKTEIALY